MNTMYNRTEDIKSLVDSVINGGINESAKYNAVSDVDNMQNLIVETMTEHYGTMFRDEKFTNMIAEDAQVAAQMYANSIQEQVDTGLITESTMTPNLSTLTASICTIMRTPYQANLHRMFDTQALPKQTVELEEVIPTIMAPKHEEEDLIDALSPYNEEMFVDKTEIYLDDLIETGLTPGKDSKDYYMTEGMDPLYRVNKDMRIDHVDITDSSGPVPSNRIKMKKGTVPYFDAKTNVMNVTFEVTNTDGSISEYEVNAMVDWSKSLIKYINASEEVKKVYFYATISHEEHTHPIKTSFKNQFRQWTVPTRPHIEVSLPQETRTDITNSINTFANTDIITAMTENISVISSRMEDQRLAKQLMSGAFYEGVYSFEAPQNFAYGNLEYFRREFIPFLDQIAIKLKTEYNIEDCHFRVLVSPYILRLLDTDYSMDKSLTEESKGSGVINYSIGVKTSTSTFYLISSQMAKDTMMKICLMPNNHKMSQVKTYVYYKYSSFLTDQIRRSDNAKMAAIVYSERNLPMVFTPLSCDLKITDLPIDRTEGSRYIRRI